MFSIDVFILYLLPRVAGYFKQNFSLIDEHESAFASLLISLIFLLKAVLRCGMSSTQSAGSRKDNASVRGIQRCRKIASRLHLSMSHGPQNTYRGQWAEREGPGKDTSIFWVISKLANEVGYQCKNCTFSNPLFS